MKRIFGLLTMVVFAFSAFADSYIETFNEVSENINHETNDVKIIRPINGGTVIIPVFDNSCPVEMIAPFSYACKIVEEYLPPCLPLKVKVSYGSVNSSSESAISRVISNCEENFGCSVYYNNAQMSTIKGVILAELCRNSTITYLDYVPDIEFLNQYPDIEITYNKEKLYDITFNMTPDPGDRYDFISLAVRDLLIGLGLSSSFRYDPVSKGLRNPSRNMTPFETYINNLLGNEGDPIVRLANATKGQLDLKGNSKNSLKLYAPETWKNGVSLNYFIPQEDCNVSKILSYDFCKGMVTRSIHDNYSDFIFYDLLGWRPSYVSGTYGTTSNYQSGSTSLLMPYNGSINLNNSSISGVVYKSDADKINAPRSARLNNSKLDSLYQYINLFHPYQSGGNNSSNEGTSVCILKKDGTWDLVQSLGYFDDSMICRMSNWTFHFDESEYARTIDGYLRARITTKKYDALHKRMEYNSKFFVVDYLPQKLGMRYKSYHGRSTEIIGPIIKPNSEIAGLNNRYRIYFSNLEGAKRVVMEILQKGDLLPNKVEITDFKKGYYTTDIISYTTTFTAVAFNDNGMSRSDPIVIRVPQVAVLFEDIEIKDNKIYIESETEFYNELIYSIYPLNSNDLYNRKNGKTSGIIDISDLAPGFYSLSLSDNNTGETKTFKFQIK